jgi:hypothetical protein
MAPGVADFAKTGAPPIVADEDGKYPVPNPGKERRREYAEST